jgi:hypothetical protein
MRTSIVHLPTDAMKIHFTDPMSPLVLSAGIRRKNEIIEIFLYSLFLIGTCTGKEKRTLGYEQNSIFGGRNERIAIAEYAALWFRLPIYSFSKPHTVLRRDLPFGGAHSFRRRIRSCSQRAARDEMKGRKTHAQTIHAMDTATGGSCADCNVLRVVACGDQSRCWTRNNTIPYHNATRPWFRPFLAPLIKEHV